MKRMLQRYEKASTIQNKNTKFFIFIVERLRVGELCSGMRKYLRRSCDKKIADNSETQIIKYMKKGAFSWLYGKFCFSLQNE
jgi:hypothetical protein